MKIGLDFDGVISDCGKLKSGVAEKLYGVKIPPERFKKELVVDTGILTSEQYRHLQKQIYGTQEFGFLMEPVKGVLEFVPRLKRDRHNLKIVTSRGEKELNIAREWMTNYGLEIQLISSGVRMSKADACKGLDVYIDDDLDKLEPLIDIVPHRYLFSWGYNQHMEIPAEIAQRMNSWHHFYEEVRRLNGN